MGQRRMQTDFQGVFKLLKNNICDLYDILENTKNCTCFYTNFVQLRRTYVVLKLCGKGKKWNVSITTVDGQIK